MNPIRLVAFTIAAVSASLMAGEPASKPTTSSAPTAKATSQSSETTVILDLSTGITEAQLRPYAGKRVIVSGLWNCQWKPHASVYGGKPPNIVQVYLDRTTDEGIEKLRELDNLPQDTHIEVEGVLGLFDFKPLPDTAGIIQAASHFYFDVEKASVKAVNPAAIFFDTHDILPGLTWAEVLANRPAAIPFDTHDGYFVSNKFEPNEPSSFLILKDQKTFDEVFGVGMVMGDKSHRLPDNAFESKIVLAVVHRGRANWTYAVQEVGVEKGVLTIRYTTTAKPSDSGEFTCPLIVSVGRGEYGAVEFVEDRKTVKRVGAAASQPATTQPATRESEPVREGGVDFQIVTPAAWALLKECEPTSISLALKVTNRTDKAIQFNRLDTVHIKVKDATGEELDLYQSRRKRTTTPEPLLVEKNQSGTIDRAAKLDSMSLSGPDGAGGLWCLCDTRLKTGKYTVSFTYENTQAAVNDLPKSMKVGNEPFWFGKVTTKELIVEIVDVSGATSQPAAAKPTTGEH